MTIREDMQQRFRVGFGGKLVLQVLANVRNDVYYVENPNPREEPFRKEWRDARLEDFTSLTKLDES